jgi:hypothetical protein
VNATKKSGRRERDTENILWRACLQTARGDAQSKSRYVQDLRVRPSTLKLIGHVQAAEPWHDESNDCDRYLAAVGAGECQSLAARSGPKRPETVSGQDSLDKPPNQRLILDDQNRGMQRAFHGGLLPGGQS